MKWPGIIGRAVAVIVFEHGLRLERADDRHPETSFSLNTPIVTGIERLQHGIAVKELKAATVEFDDQIRALTNCRCFSIRIVDVFFTQ